MNFFILTLGCKVNNYESEAMSALLTEKGYHASEIDYADIYIINTCSVTHVSDAKSRQMIRKMITRNPNGIIVVVGCYAQMSLEVVRAIEGVNIVIGTKYRSKIADYIEEYLKDKEQIVIVEPHDKNVVFENLRVPTFHQTRAYIKIQDGCNNFCSYCIIPFARGGERSRDFNEIIREVGELVDKGFKEIVLTGIHTGAYLFDGYHLVDLLEKIIDRYPILVRIRLSSIEIMEIDNRLIELMKNNKVMASHLHIPLQSGEDSVLKSMNRRYDTKQFKERISIIKRELPHYSITTDIIVGFPGESETSFEETCTYIKELDFMRLHVFTYSPRKGTKASMMPEQVTSQDKKNRSNSLISLSRKLNGKIMAAQLNKKVKILVEAYDQKTGMISGYTSSYLKVNAYGNEGLINQEVEVIVEKFLDDTMFGKIQEKEKIK